MKKNEIVVIIPTLNEAEGIGPTLAELKNVLDNPHVIVIDGHSVDRTVGIARKMDADVYVQNGKGKGLAVSQVLKYLDSDTHYVIFIDADFTYPATDIPYMLKILDANPQVGMVVGNRFNSDHDLSRSMLDIYFLGNRLIAFVHKIASGLNMEDPLSGLRVIRWDLLKEWDPKSKGSDVETELNFFIAKKGYGIVEIPIKYRPRLGDKKLGLRHGFTILRRVLSEAMT